jgi:putative FmdB family regulatory protein
VPIYEYQCRTCQKTFSLLIMNASSYGRPKCPKCGSEDLERLMSRFRAVRSESSRMERLTDSSNFGDVDENDPSSVAKWAKKMGRELGDEAGEGFDEMVDQAIEEETHKKQGQSEEDSLE